MKPLKLISVFIFLILISFNSYAKTTKTYSADKAFKNHKYHKAIEGYKKLEKKLEKKRKNADDKTRIIFQLAECYRLVNDSRRAESQYKRAIKANYQETDSIVILHYANMLKSNEKYELALEQYRAFQEFNSNDSRVLNGIRSCALALEWLANPRNYTITKLKEINSRSSDFAAAYLGSTYSTLVFTSTRSKAIGKQTDEWTNQKFSDLFISRVDRSGKWSSPVLLDNEEQETQNFELINTIANEGTPSFNKNFTRIYFTRCPNFKKEVSGCQIYNSKRIGTSWSKPTLVGFSNDTIEVYGHPSLSLDELTIIFSSEREGGYGSKDLWTATRSNADAAFSSIKNLGPTINTAGEEVFPFLRNDTALYFSSNGHIGIGGLDLFKAKKLADGAWELAQNLRVPMNSSKDDFSIIFHPNREEGYFASNRKGSRSDDLYSFIIPIIKLSLNGKVRDQLNQEPITTAKIKLSGPNGISTAILTDENGVYQFASNQLELNKAYTLTITNPDHFTLKDTISTYKLIKSKTFNRDFDLDPIPETPIVLPDILYDLGKWNLRSQYQDSLLGLIKTLEDNETLIIELASHTDSRDSHENNNILSDKRARSVVDYLILRGIDQDRLVAKGYGEQQPRRLTKDIDKNSYSFKKNFLLDESFINSLESNSEKETAHSLNRRTEFRVIGKDFIPKNQKENTNNRDLYSSNNRIIPFTLHADSGFVQADCFLNGLETIFTFKKNARPKIALRQALRLYNKGLIERTDFIGNTDKIFVEGTISNHAIFILKELTIANKTIKNVEIEVDNRLDFNFVIGTSTLIRFGVFAFDNESQEIIFK